MILVVAELVVLLVWFFAYRVSHYGDLIAKNVVPVERLAWPISIASWIISGITLAATLIFLYASQRVEMSHIGVTLVVRLTLTGLSVFAIICDLNRQKLESAVALESSYGRAGDNDGVNLDGDD
jgi:hypothetical protein